MAASGLQSQNRLRAGIVPGPIVVPVDFASLCPDHLAGDCREKSACRKGIHGFHLVKEEETAMLGKAVSEQGKPNVLSSVHRKIGMVNADATYHNDLPGVRSAQGPRHDNDYAEVSSIRVYPTTDEILSLRLPHLPAKDEAIKQDWGTSEQRLQIHCATMFRHLRHELCEPIMDCVYLSTQMLVRDSHSKPLPTSSDYRYHWTTVKGASFNYFNGVEVEDVAFQEYNGLQVRMSYNCPRALRDDGMRTSTVFEQGMLCALVAVNAATDEIYTVFLETFIRHSTNAMRHKTGNHTRAAVIFKLAEPENTLKARELMWLVKLAPPTIKFALIDLPGVLMAGSVHHLYRLRNLSTNEGDQVPFTKNIMAHSGSSEVALSVGRPAYSQKDGFEWVLNGLKSGLDDVKPFILNTDNKSSALAAMEAKSSLDNGQAAALYENLTRELAFTQGPPGTGKSFLGIATVKVFVDSVPKEDRGPIIVVAQTNHALDEILEGLLAKGIDGICRFGARSKSTKLLSSTLKSLRRQHKDSCQEFTRRRCAEDKARNLLQDGVTCCETLCATDVVLSNFKDMSINPNVSLSDTTDNPSDKSSVVSDALPSANPPPPPPPPPSSAPPHGRARNNHRENEDDRKRQTQAYIKSLTKAEQCDTIVEIHRRLVAARVSLSDARRLKDLHILQRVDVIGMTTTACAREVELIKQLQPRILVIEEASEVLEAHTICALTPSIQHCINIGDPLQLRPHVGSSLLNTEYNQTYRLNEPLFERLISAGLPYAKLSVQRRAHPDLSKLIQVTDYPYVVNHENTLSREPVPGMASRMQWHNHTHNETLMKPGDGIQTDSWANEYEAEMVVSFATKFIKHHGHGPGDVAVITPYNGQLALITAKLVQRDITVHVSNEDKEKLMTGGYMSRGDIKRIDGDTTVGMGDMLRVATLDNFQGEEAKIVILSTVRSNTNNKIGFLKTSNRINVAVSRAQEGFFVVGNAGLLRSNSAHWGKIIDQFEKQGALKDGFEVLCRYHPEERILIDSLKSASEASDWTVFGCSVCNSW